MCMFFFCLFFFYLHQLSEEIHGYCRAFVEEHGDTSQEALKDRVQRKETSLNRVNQLSNEEIQRRIAVQGIYLTVYTIRSYQLSVHGVHHQCYAASAASSLFPK